MKLFFSLFGALIALLWIAARVWVPPNVPPGMTVLSWSTDPNPARKAQLAPFYEKNPNVLVKIEPNTRDKIIVQCSSRVGADLIEIYSATDMISFVESGVLLDLTPYARKMGFSSDITFPSLRGNIMHEGRQYRFPCNIGNQVLLYNKKKFRDAGLPEPQDAMTWDDFIRLVKPLTIKRKEGKGFEQFALMMNRGYVKDIHLQFGARFYSPDGTRSALDSPQSIAAIQFFHDLIKVHEIMPSKTMAKSLSGEGGWGGDEIRAFATGKAACLWGARWMMVQFRQYPELKNNIGAVLLPHPPGGTPANYCGTRGSGINVNTANLEASLKFMQYLASDEYNRVIAQSADGLPPNAAFAADPKNLVNPDYPWEDEKFQEVFVRSMEYAASPEASPFIDPTIVDTIWEEALDYVENDLQPADQAMREAAKRVNDRIQTTLRDQPELRERYEALRRQSANASQ